MKLNPKEETEKIIIDLGLQHGGAAEAYLTKRIADRAKKYVPYSGVGTGNYHLNENVVVGQNYIDYNQPYASYQYYGIIWGKEVPDDHYTTPGTGHHWDERMLSAEGEDLNKEMENYIAKRGRA